MKLRALKLSQRRELDLRILQEALSREAEEERSEMAAKAKRMEDMKFYREQLAIMMAKVRMVCGMLFLSLSVKAE